MDEQGYAELFGVELPGQQETGGGQTETGANPETGSPESATETATETGGETGTETGGEAGQSGQSGQSGEAGQNADGGEGTGGETGTEAPAGTEKPGEDGAGGENPDGAKAANTEAIRAEAQKKAIAAALERIRKKASEDAQKQLDENVKAMGLQNPYTKEPITTKAQFDAYQAEKAQRQKSQILKKAGMSEDDLKAMIEQLPEVRQAREQAQAAQQQAQQLRAQEARKQVDAQLAEIQKLDPSVKSLDDLTKAENYQELLGRVKKGYSLLDAYRIVNFDKLTARQTAAAKQQVRNQTAGKQHMQATKSRGSGAVAVPADVAEEYRELMPDITDKEIEAHYNRYRQSVG